MRMWKALDGSSRFVIAAGLVLILALGFRTMAGASTPQVADLGPMPSPQIPVGLSKDNPNYGQEMRLWGDYTNDEWVGILNEEIANIEKDNADGGYDASLKRAQQQLEAICALPDTTVC